MSDIDTAERVSTWIGLGIKMPKELATFIEIFEAVRWTEVERPTVFDIRSLTTKNAEDKIRELAEQLVVSEVPGGGLSVLGKAKQQVLGQAARNVNQLAGLAVPDFIEQLTPEFDKHAAAYIEAVEQLPDKIDSDALLKGGTAAVTAYQAAQVEAGYLNRISTWVASTRELGMHSGDPDPALRILRPTSVTQLFKLDEAQARPASPTLSAINAVLLTAARLEVPFAINTIRECAQIRRDLTTVHQPADGVMTLR